MKGPNGARIALRHARALGTLGEAELSAWLARGPVFVSLARYEPFGLAVLEAAQAGCALVLSDIPSFRELWEGAAEFLPCDATDTAIADSIRRVLRGRERRDALRAAARKRSRRYGVEAMTEGMLRVYAQAMARQGETGEIAA
jgi:glycosyltransferase involved in cell wall biosynthesis